MPRGGDGVYAKPSGTTAVSGATVASAPFNQVIDDLVDDANAARPVVAGGTGATTPSAARTALSAQASDALLTAIANLVTVASRFLQFTGVDTVAVFDLFGTENTWTDQIIDGTLAVEIVQFPPTGTAEVKIYQTVTGNIVIGTNLQDVGNEKYFAFGQDGVFGPLSGDTRILQAPATQTVASAGFRGLGSASTPDAAYNFVLSDTGSARDHTSASPHTYTVQPSATLTLPANSVLCGKNWGSGILTIARGAGVAFSDSAGVDANLTVNPNQRYWLRRHPTNPDLYDAAVS